MPLVKACTVAQFNTPFTRPTGYRKRAYTFSFCSKSLNVLAPTDLAHLKLKEASLFLHLLCDLGTADLRPNHPVLSGMLLFLLLNLGAARSTE